MACMEDMEIDFLYSVNAAYHRSELITGKCVRVLLSSANISASKQLDEVSSLG